jgi:CelD/BcsL family acetyltransferase involved in cellulose biosynthesis
VRIEAGQATLGYVYNFVHQGRVYFYQSGINYGLSKHNESPGLMIHCLMMDHNARLGHTTYDMLAGGGQYKRGLTTHSEELKWVAIQQPRMKLAVERVARSLHERLKKSTVHL